jgi:hypothetical protein
MIQRRKFIAGLGGAAAWPLAAGAQQRAMPVIGYLSSRTADSDASMLVSLRRGLGDVGYAEDRNVAIEYRFTDGRYDPLSAQLADLTQRKVRVIVFVGAFTEEPLQLALHDGTASNIKARQWTAGPAYAMGNRPGARLDGPPEPRTRPGGQGGEPVPSTRISALAPREFDTRAKSF